jgi:hypothetical protein
MDEVHAQAPMVRPRDEASITLKGESRRVVAHGTRATDAGTAGPRRAGYRLGWRSGANRISCGERIRTSLRSPTAIRADL